MQTILMNHAFTMPSYATEHSAGRDLYAAVASDCVIAPGESFVVPTGIRIKLPKGHEAQIRPRSGMAAKNGVTVLNSPGTIDEDYRGEVQVILINHGKAPFVVFRGMRIAQMVVAAYVQPEMYAVQAFDDTTARGDGGFGSTG
jgi:dUTP pyrophosphatase